MCRQTATPVSHGSSAWLGPLGDGAEEASQFHLATNCHLSLVDSGLQRSRAPQPFHRVSS